MLHYILLTLLHVGLSVESCSVCYNRRSDSHAKVAVQAYDLIIYLNIHSIIYYFQIRPSCLKGTKK